MFLLFFQRASFSTKKFIELFNVESFHQYSRTDLESHFHANARVTASDHQALIGGYLNDHTV